MKIIEDAKAKRDNSTCTYLTNNAAAFVDDVAMAVAVMMV